MEQPDYNDGVSVECQVGQHPAFDVAMCEHCDESYCEKHAAHMPGLCRECGMTYVLEQT